MPLFLILHYVTLKRTNQEPKIVPVVFASGRSSPTTYISFEKWKDSTEIFIYTTTEPTNKYSYKYYKQVKTKKSFKQGYVIFDLPLLPLKKIYALVFTQDGQLYSTKPFVYSENNENYVFWTPFPQKENFSWVLFGISMGVILLFIIGLLYLVIVDDLRFC